MIYVVMMSLMMIVMMSVMIFMIYTVVLLFMMWISPCSAVGHPKDLATAVAFKQNHQSIGPISKFKNHQLIGPTMVAAVGREKTS